MEKFSDPLIVILMVIGVLSVAVAVYEYKWLGEGLRVFFEPIGIFVAIGLATMLSFYFERKAQREFNILNNENAHSAVKVIRNGNVAEIDKCDIVVGDIIIVEAGDEVCADARIIDAHSLLVDESTLTGEPPHHKGTLNTNTTKTEHEQETTYPTDRLYRGTFVVEGNAHAEVTTVGDKTEQGKIMLTLTAADPIRSDVKTPLDEQLGRLGRMIAQMSYAIALLVIVGRMIMYFSNGYTLVTDGTVSHFLTYLFQTLMIAVTLVVMSVPEGLPMAVSLALANSMRKMLKTGNLVRRIHACETMGAATVICTDKTGTLTENRMAVAKTTFNEQLDNDKREQLLTENIALNSTANIDFEHDKVIGNPTEGALLKWILGKGHDYRNIRENNKIAAVIPFSTERKYMATLVEPKEAGQKAILYVKGAPEIVARMCGNNPPKGETLRTISLAYTETDATNTEITPETIDQLKLTMLATIGIEDPVRNDVAEAVNKCQEAGIDIIIVTGDNGTTARNVAEKIGIWKPNYSDSNIITGEQLSALSDDALSECAKQLKIVCRARPMDKQRLVRALQQRGEVVAVTGDGTNDAPALHQAHIGLSMGSGTKVAKEASDITITDDSFASIARAVEWGRALYRNIQRFLLFQLTVNVAACLLVLTGAFTGTETPLTVTQMLWINLIMDTFAAFALSALPPYKDLMTTKPRNRRAFILDKDMLINIFGVGLTFFALLAAMLYCFEHCTINSIFELTKVTEWHKDGLNKHELTLLFTIFVTTHFWYLFNSRAYKSRGSGLNLKGCGEFAVTAIIIAIGQILIVQIPIVNDFFNVEPLGRNEWILIIALSPLVVVIREIYSKTKREITRLS